IRFAYGQISKKRHFVRKIRVKSWCISQNKKKIRTITGTDFKSLFSCGVRLHTLYNQVPARIPPIASKDSLDETSSPSVAQSLRTGS
ncbi:MAG: hypothetical protein ACIRZ5_08555, partial [Ligilactobacillus ruminis]